MLIIIDCPSREYLPVLVSHSAFHEYYKGKTKCGNQVKCIIHITPYSVSQLPEYQAWINKFQEETKHVFLNETCPSQNLFLYSEKMQIVLNTFHPDIFPLSPPVIPTKFDHVPTSFVVGENLMKIHLQPPSIKQIIERVPIQHSSIEGIQKNITEDPLFQTTMSEILEETRNFQHNSPNDDELVFLGSSGATSTQYRSETCQMITIKGYGNILMDCGEGSLLQLRRAYGSEFQNIIKNLKCIFVSHKHPE